MLRSCILMLKIVVSMKLGFKMNHRLTVIGLNDMSFVRVIQEMKLLEMHHGG